MTGNILKSPKGQIQWMAAENPVEDKKTGKKSYSIKLAFDVKKDKKWLDSISEINDAKVVTAQTYRGKNEDVRAVLATGKAFVEARSNFKPEVYDADGNVLEEAPMFFAYSTGTAQMYVQPYTSDKGGTINLVGIKIHTIETPPREANEAVDRETRLAQLRALAKED